MEPRQGLDLKSISAEHKRKLSVRRTIVRPGGERIAKIPPRETRKLA